MRGPYTFTITWEPGSPLMCAAEIPVEAVAKHVRIVVAPGLKALRGERYLVLIVYDVPELQAVREVRQLVGVRQGGAIGGPNVALANCVGGFIHPDDGGGWLVYELDKDEVS